VEALCCCVGFFWRLPAFTNHLPDLHALQSNDKKPVEETSPVQEVVYAIRCVCGVGWSGVGLMGPLPADCRATDRYEHRLAAGRK